MPFMAAAASVALSASIIIVALSCLPQLVFPQSQDGFVSIDCGATATAPYKDASGIIWTPDKVHMPDVLGNTATVATNASVAPLDLDSNLESLRYFPSSLNQTKFCYSLGPVEIGSPYLIRALILYGNYDSRNRDTIVFSLLLNADLWSNIQLSKTSSVAVFELQAPALTTEFSVCVARTGTDDPFINSLELRPLASGMSSVMMQQAAGNYALYNKFRINYGAKSTGLIRFPEDRYDRFWYPNTGTPTSSTNTDVSVTILDAPPPSVMQTAFGDGIGTSYTLTFSSLGNGDFFLELYFAEIDGATRGERVFDVEVNGALFRGALDIYATAGNKPFSAISLYSNSTITITDGLLNVTLFSNDTATHGPIVAAVEVCQFSSNPINKTTDTEDVAALDNVKKSLRHLNDWTGDPCMPTGYGYTWVTCSFTATPRITALSLSSLNLSGSLPPDIGTLTALEKIHLDNNMIGGNIPDLSQLRQLQRLDLRNNNLQGPIPDFLGALPRLSQLLLQGNNFSGPIPQGLLQKTENGSLNFSYDRNPYLCVTPNATCKASSAVNPPSPTRKLKTYVIVIIIVGVISAIAIGIAAIFCLRTNNKTGICLLRKKADPRGEKIVPSPAPEPWEDRVDIAAQTMPFTLEEVRTMTHEFRDKIGRGGFGDVFLGEMEGGQYVAVKTSAKNSSQGVREFLTEVSILSRVHHRNLVSLVGYCNEPPERMLIYEYMSNGTLADHLYGPKASLMSWKMRIMIAIDAAQGLEYLHFACQPRIIHRDVKSSNILLNDNMGAKVADFGLSRSKLEDNESHIAATNVMGTHGYLDPEYYATSLLTDKSDVYSFGVVLFELVCGCPAIVKDREKPNLTDWVKGFLYAGDLRSITDPVLGTNYNEESMWKAAELGLRSTERDRSNRPDMNEVVAELREALRIENSQSQHGRREVIAPARDRAVRDLYDSSYDSFHDFPSGDLYPRASSTSFKDSNTFVRPR